MSFASKVKEELLNKTGKENNKTSNFLRETFILYGTMTDPQKCYHLQFSLQDESIVNRLLKSISKIKASGIEAKKIKRNGSYVVYIKAVESITDFLAYIGATNSAMEIMQIRMLKDVRNYANRATNFETANLDKTLSASQRHIEAIKKIKSTIGIKSLPEDLREVAELRLKNPDMSLKTLSCSLKSPISRSGVNHRLERIIQISQDLKKV